MCDTHMCINNNDVDFLKAIKIQQLFFRCKDDINQYWKSQRKRNKILSMWGETSEHIKQGLKKYSILRVSFIQVSSNSLIPLLRSNTSLGPCLL